MNRLFLSLFLLATTSAFSQDGYLELFRRDMKADKLKLMIAAMELQEPASTKFWEIYGEYDKELAKLGDRIIANIKDYAEHEFKMTEDKADELITNGFSNREDRMDLLKKYYKKVKKELGARIAARFVQAELQVLTLIDARVLDAVPLVRVPK